MERNRGLTGWEVEVKGLACRTMEVPDWLMLRCGACRDELKIPRGLAVVYVRCPGCAEVVSVPGGVLDPARRFQVFEADVAALPVPVEGEVVGGNGGVEVPKPTVDVPERRFGKPSGTEPQMDGPAAAKNFPSAEAGNPSAEALKGLRSTEEFASKDTGGGSSHHHGHRGRRRGHEAPVWDSASDRGRASSDRMAKRFVQFAVGGIIVLGAGLGVMMVLDQGTEDVAGAEIGGAVQAGTPKLAPVNLGAIEPVEQDDDFGALEEAVEAFYAAETLEELKRTVRDEERVGPLMQRYYGADGFKKMQVRTIAESGLPMEVDGLWRVPVVLGDRTRKMVAVEQVGDRYLVDWESYVGHPSMPWTELLVKKPREEVTMRVWAKPTNYYNYDFSDEVALGCWSLMSPDKQVEIYGYAQRGSDLAKRLDEILSEDEAKAIIVSFRYPEIARESRQVVLTGLVREEWVMP